MADSVRSYVEGEATLYRRDWIKSSVIVVTHLLEIGHCLREQLVALSRLIPEVRFLASAPPCGHRADRSIQEGISLGRIDAVIAAPFQA